MKTIFITCFTGLISRNILATDVLPRLLHHGSVRLVVVAPESRAKVLREEFGGERVVVEGVAMAQLRGLERFFWMLATNFLSTTTRRVQRRAKFARDGSRFDYAVSLLLGFLGRSRVVRRIFRAVANAAAPAGSFAHLFDRYHPDLVFSTDVYTPEDVRLMRIARRRGIRVIGMVRSWDNVTSKTLLTVIPDRLAVNTERIGQEAVGYGDVPAERIRVVGIPHYERYRTEPRTPRDAFFGRYGFDPSKKMILFAPPSDTYLKGDPIAPVVLEALERVDAQILVRMPLVGATELGGCRPAAHVAFDRPENSPDFIEAHLSRAADQHLADSIYHSDLVITWASTMIIDAIVFGKPVVLIGFDSAPRPYAKSITQYYDYDHQKRILETGGVRLARNPEELADSVGRYLGDPNLDRAGRQRILAEYCGALDGKSGERVANLLLSLV